VRFSEKNWLTPDEISLHLFVQAKIPTEPEHRLPDDYTGGIVVLVPSWKTLKPPEKSGGFFVLLWHKQRSCDF
jgi:hypothetical protein